MKDIINYSKRYIAYFLVGFAVFFLTNSCETALALETINIDFSNFENLLDNSEPKYRENIDSMIDYVSKYDDDYYYILTFDGSIRDGSLYYLSRFNFKLVPKNDYLQKNVGVLLQSNN